MYTADADGCPETNADGDTLDDEADECPAKAEDMDGIRDGDGCPEDADGSLAGPYAMGGTAVGVLLAGAGLVGASALTRSALSSRIDSASSVGLEGEETIVDQSQLSQQEAFRMRNRADSLQTAGVWTLGVGGVGLAAAAIWMAGDGDRPFWRSRAGVSVAPLGDGFAFRLRMTWP